jgi:hypothetical protein
MTSRKNTEQRNKKIIVKPRQYNAEMTLSFFSSGGGDSTDPKINGDVS